MTIRKGVLIPGVMGIIRLHDQDGSGRLPLPDPELGRLRLFDRVDSSRAIRRLRPECQRSGLLPYGVWELANGSEVLFNRHYQPICQRSGDGTVTLCPNPDEWIDWVDVRWFYYDGHSEGEKRRRAEEALRCLLAGEPLPPDWQGLHRT